MTRQPSSNTRTPLRTNANRTALGYRARRAEQRVDYLDRRDEVAFIDRGHKIDVLHSCDEAAVLAALRLAAAKWGTVRANGNIRFRELCAQLAEEHQLVVITGLERPAEQPRAPEPARHTPPPMPDPVPEPPRPARDYRRPLWHPLHCDHQPTPGRELARHRRGSDPRRRHPRPTRAQLLPAQLERRIDAKKTPTIDPN